MFAGKQAVAAACETERARATPAAVHVPARASQRPPPGVAPPPTTASGGGCAPPPLAAPPRPAAAAPVSARSVMARGRTQVLRGTAHSRGPLPWPPPLPGRAPPPDKPCGCAPPPPAAPRTPFRSERERPLEDGEGSGHQGLGPHLLLCASSGSTAAAAAALPRTSSGVLSRSGDRSASARGGLRDGT